VVALEHNYITGVAIAESAELAEITNTMRDSNITFIDTSVNYKLSNWGFYVACYRLFQTDHPLRIHPLSLNLILQQTRCRLHLHQLPISKRSFRWLNCSDVSICTSAVNSIVAANME
ncbi:hypothetical protein Tsp_14513, partial [Trichinella spiralis]|uniref:hypothetical protein n=1 Tax=Trichinella spiralis TaxID=6334 RepID=UPI0001EFEFA0